MTYMIRFPVGDWSNDGHGKCEYFEVRSSHPAEYLREVHFKAPKIVGFDIGDICCDYEDSHLNDDVVKKLLAVGIHADKYASEEEYYMDPEGMIDLWLDILKYIDPSIELKICKSEAKDINFYGCDNQQRHLYTPGYGLY